MFRFWTCYLDFVRKFENVAPYNSKASRNIRRHDSVSALKVQFHAAKLRWRRLPTSLIRVKMRSERSFVQSLTLLFPIMRESINADCWSTWSNISKHFLIDQFFKLPVQCSFIHDIVGVISPAKLRSMKKIRRF